MASISVNNTIFSLNEIAYFRFYENATKLDLNIKGTLDQKLLSIKNTLSPGESITIKFTQQDSIFLEFTSSNYTFSIDHNGEAFLERLEIQSETPIF
jgi:hypothetical protein